jgi:hypothetical protein
MLQARSMTTSQCASSLYMGSCKQHTQQNSTVFFKGTTCIILWLQRIMLPHCT